MKKFFLSCFLAVGLAFISPLPAAVPGAENVAVFAAETDDSVPETPATKTTEPNMPVPLPSGWQQDANGWYYLQDGIKLTGWQDLDDGHRYYFTKLGYRVYGIRKIKGVCYLFRPETDSIAPGALCDDVSGLTHFESDPDTYYYLTSGRKGILAVNKWVKSNGGRYYANARGKIKLGTIKVNQKRYHVTQKGRMTFYGKSSYDKGFYYAGSDGVLKTGFQTIGGIQYYFDLKTGRRASGIIKIGSDTYYFRKNGAARTGWVKESSGTKVYYYDANGRRISGWYTIDGKKYYFDPENDDARVQASLKKIGSEYFCFDAYGVLQTGIFTFNGKRYYASTSGILQKGWQTIEGRKYYINPKTFTMKTGWLKYNNKKYYLNPMQEALTYCSAVTGFVNISTKNGKAKYWYYFNSDGTLYTGGWLTLSEKRYYFSPVNGRMFTGKHTIAGVECNFGTNGVYIPPAPTGPWRIEVNRRSCFVVVYRGSTPVKAFVCSTAKDGVSTPTGTFSLKDKLRWHELMGPSWGQYCSHITSDILFHSVPNLQPDNHTLETWEYNKLGTPASAGCIRLTVKHAKYLYDNCPIGTPVIINDYVARPTSIAIETAPKIPSWQNYDPTDPYA